ncbi:YbfB/YjiJ family MFS transporter [Mycolicibacterium vaccae]|uniref:Arabinose efflux permease family protein n=1 Tax=Mycolicibacterium vaccae ATCC 25954 TaxID=1194972 RepID=K0UVR9_MYCVA|nr:YbfB/YjiJ family MFS transporter [Mycolicibacterium vaccae]ANI42811.1 arabinose efflux permease family protein [Mycolicibacterium vaccae 95051]EJZ06708.1 arabinose efflux permease family protein [Mycolicibacterium vaccae ATCC 25954]MCV7061169.1 YbfB/YjiJ family MFS transporter [Mycolicibacterium vaccae]
MGIGAPTKLSGLASPPLATALAQRLSAERADRAQTIVNAGTGIGVVVSGPIAFALFDQWLAAWITYGLLTVAVTAWVAFALRNGPAAGRRVREDRGFHPGTGRLLTASLLTGLGSIAVWNFGRDLISTGSGGDAVATTAWMMLGGSAVQRLGFRPTWVVTVSAMSAAPALLALSLDHTAGILLSAGMFGAAYIGLSGLLLLWSTRLYPESAAFGVGMSFFAIAAGQAIGAPVVGALIESFGYTAAFLVFAVVSLIPAVLSPVSDRMAPGTGVTARR